MTTRRVRRLRSVLVVALSVASFALLTGCGDGGDADAGTTGPPASARPRALETDFEAGTTAGWTSTAGATVTETAAASGAFGLDVTAEASDAYARWAAPGDLPFWSFRARVRVVAWTPGESVDLFTVRNREITDNFDLFVGGTDRAFQWDLFREDSARAGGSVELGRWYLVEARGSFATTTSSAEVRIDGVPQPGIASRGRPASAVREFVIGSVGTTKTNRVQFDDVRVQVSDAPVALLGPPAVIP
jgi:hypothetical protein